MNSGQYYQLKGKRLSCNSWKIKIKNGDNLNIIRRETSRNFRNKRREYLKEIINVLERYNKKKNIRELCRHINEFRRATNPDITQ